MNIFSFVFKNCMTLWFSNRFVFSTVYFWSVFSGVHPKVLTLDLNTGHILGAHPILESCFCEVTKITDLGHIKIIYVGYKIWDPKILRWKVKKYIFFIFFIFF